jgi:GR25 family glycosyltransferase involved in LPS biosynthesis
MGKKSKQKNNTNNNNNNNSNNKKEQQVDEELTKDSKVKFDDNVQVKNITTNKKQNTDKVKKSKTLCLNMIVKNESHIIKETLECVSKYIDYWVICDTGSTDGTQDLIKGFFEDKGIPGELLQHEWRDFGYNRSLAFKHAYNKTDYVWVIDADDLVVGEIIFPEKWDKDFYFFKFGQGFTYERQQIFNNRLKWEYKGVLHEYPRCTSKQNLTADVMSNNFFIDSRRLGDRSKDPKKYLKDAERLVKAIDEEPDMAVRYTFYAAQSYKDYGDFENSIKYYKKRIEQGGWNEELFISWLEIGNGLVRLKRDKKEIADAYLNGFKVLPQRAETLYLLGEYYFNTNDLENSYKVCRLGLNISMPTQHKLFLQADVYQYRLKELLYRICIGVRDVKIQIKNVTEERINKEIDELYKFLTTDSIVPDYIKQRVIQFTKSIQLEDIKEIPDGYEFIPGVDSFGNDIGHFGNKSIQELADIADLYDNCVCFNSYGYLKHTISEKDKFIRLNPLLYKNDGLFIKKNKTEEIIAKKEERIKERERFNYYNNDLIEKITNNIKNSKVSENLITLTITTCKRYDLFERTINSFINCCKDIEKINRFICIDDNSSDTERNKMKELYPFFEFVMKTPEQKGHVVSMNMILDMVDSEYLIHLEDDWLFYEEYDFVTKCLEVISEKKIQSVKNDIPDNQEIDKKEIGQVLFNKNYTEVEETIVQGGYKCKTTSGYEYLLHEYYDPNSDKDNYIKAISKYGGVGTCIYWPHYSFRPSLIKTSVFKKVGKYIKESGFFEMDYARRYISNNYVSVFLDKVCCRHIGKLTSEKNDDKTKNAYALNEVEQFTGGNSSQSNKESGQKNKSEPVVMNSESNEKVICVNLERRPDRKEEVSKEFEKHGIKNYSFYNAMDGKRIKENKELAKLFYGNDFGSRKGVIGCALSHIDLWVKLLESKDDYYIVTEDDILLTNNFAIKNDMIIKFLKNNLNKIDFIYTGYHMFAEHKKQHFDKYFKETGEIKITNLDRDVFIGGTFSYIVTRRGAENILKYIKENGVRHGIDYLFKINKDLVIMETAPHLIISDWVSTQTMQVDSDIQKDHDRFEFKFDIEIKKDLVPVKFLSTNFIIKHFRTILNSIELTSISNSISEEWVFFKELDTIGDDLTYVGKQNLEELKNSAESKKECVAFNTLGFLKKSVDLNKLVKSNYFSQDDGLYVKKSIVMEYMKKNNMDISKLKNDKKLNNESESNDESESDNESSDKSNGKKYRVKLLCNWEDSKKLCDEWNNLTKGNYTWDSVQFVWDDVNIDYWVIINYPPPNSTFDKTKTILFHMEPWCNSPEQKWGVKTWGTWADPNPDEFLALRTHKYTHNNATWQLKLTYSELKSNPIVKSPEYGNKISSICSSKYFDPGHKKRVDFIKYIESKSDPSVQIDIWGFDNKLGFSNYKGACPIDNKDIGIVPYKYYLIAENNIEHNYVTEKFWEPILSECLVFYYGCPNLTDYIDSRAFVSIDLTQDFDSVFNTIKNAIENNLWEERLPYIREAKHKILDYYNFCPTVERIIKEHEEKAINQ